MQLQALMLEVPAAGALGAALRTALASRGVALDRVPKRGAFELALEATDYDCAVLIQATGIDNIAQLLDTLARDRPGLSLIVVTAGTAMSDRVVWLDRGADDAVPADIDTKELAARVAAAARRAYTHRRPRTLTHGPLTLEPEGSRATWRGSAVPLTIKEYRLLEVLVRGARQIHSRDSLHTALGAESGERASNAIDVHVHALRRKLHPMLVRTVRGLGYRLADADALDA